MFNFRCHEIQLEARLRHDQYVARL
jgi:hypothetical protein